MMHNIINSLRGEAVPEQGAMHGSAIQVSRQITSPRLCPTTCVRFNDSCFINIGQKPSRRRYRLGRWKDLPARSPITGPARRATKTFWRAPKKHHRYSGLGGPNCPLSQRVHLFLLPVKLTISLAPLRRTDGMMVAKQFRKISAKLLWP
jgi:hypothetical protein